MLSIFQKFSTLTVLLCAIGFGSGTAHAYLSPSEVFTDLDMPEGESEAPEESAPPPPEEETAETPPPAIEQESSAPPPQKNEPETPQSTEQKSSSAPVFFRAGEVIEQSTIPAVDSTSTDSPFEEDFEILIPSLPSPKDIDAESEAILEELQEEEESLMEAEQEEVLPAAPRKKKKSVPMAIIGRAKYLGGGVALAGLAFLFLKKKKKSAAQKASAESTKPEDTIPAPEKLQQVEKSSHRLEHALEALGEKPAEQEAAPSDDEAIGFSNAPVPGQEEKPQ